MKKFLLALFFLLMLIGNPGFSKTSFSEPVKKVQPVQEVVYITKSGSKYHKGSCHFLKKSKIKISKSEAKSAGYSPCSVCKP